MSRVQPVAVMQTYFFFHREETCEQAAVLHYTYNRFEDLKSRRDRCDCAPTEDDAKRCFILPFDRSVSQTGQFSICVQYAFWHFFHATL